MEAVILAGGFGTRLRPFTFIRAKPLLPILNKPMITYIIETLPPEVDTVILAVNYRKEQIEQYFKTHDYGKNIIVNEEANPLGTGGAVKFAEQYLTGPFFVLNADNICSLNLGSMLRFHQKKRAFATISLWPLENVSEFGVVDMKENGNIVKFVEKPKTEDAPSDLINAGAYLLEHQVLDYIEPDRLVSMEKEIFPQIIRETGMFYGYQFKGYWIDVGRIHSYIDVHRLLMERQQVTFLMGDACHVQGQLDYTSIGSHVTIGENSILRSSVVFDKVTIGQNTTIERSVLGESCQIGNNVSLKDVAVGDHEKISANTKLENMIVWNQPIPEGYPQKQIGNVIGE